MDPVTHMVTGALVAQALAPAEQRWIFALIGAGAAVVPDIDFLARKAPGSLLFLRLHRGLTHSALAVPLIAACAAASGWLLFDAAVWPLFRVSLLAALSHLALDTIMHSSGPQWLWPLRRRLSVPLLIGLNPLTTSARCGERSLLVCLRCVMHGAVLNPLVLLLWAGLGVSAVAGLVAPGAWRGASQGALALAALHVLLCALLRLRAGGLLRRALVGRAAGAPAPVRSGVYAASVNPARWLGVVQDAEGFTLWRVDALRGAVELFGRRGPSDADAAVEASCRSPVMREFMDNAAFPHATLLPGGARGAAHAGSVVVWRDLAFAFSPAVSLCAARVDLAPDGSAARAEYRSRWDRPPEERS